MNASNEWADEYPTDKEYLKHMNKSIAFQLHYNKDVADKLSEDIIRKVKEETLTESEFEAIFILLFAITNNAQKYQSELFTQENIHNLCKGILPDKEIVERMKEYEEFAFNMMAIDDNIALSI